jgi:hypothetical protein
MNRTLLLLLTVVIGHAALAQKKREIIPRDSITNKYCYTAISDSIPGASKDKLHARMDKWIKENYNPEKSQYTQLSTDGDTYTIHDREAIPGAARKFVEYNLTVDLKDHKYRYKLTDLEYVAVGKYPLEDKMATDKKSDFEAMDEILSGILRSMDASLKKGEDW